MTMKVLEGKKLGRAEDYEFWEFSVERTLGNRWWFWGDQIKILEKIVVALDLGLCGPMTWIDASSGKLISTFDGNQLTNVALNLKEQEAAQARASHLAGLMKELKVSE